MRTICIALFLSLAGCQYDPHGHLLTIKEPRDEDIIGIYILDRADLPRDASIDPAIRVEIRADGTFSAYRVPPWEDMNPDDRLQGSLLDGKGRWEKSTMGLRDPGGQDIWGLYLRTPDKAESLPEFDRVLGRAVRRPVPQISPPNFTGTHAPYGLIFMLGDPDGGAAILLKRKP